MAGVLERFTNMVILSKRLVASARPKRVARFALLGALFLAPAALGAGCSDDDDDQTPRSGSGGQGGGGGRAGQAGQGPAGGGAGGSAGSGGGAGGGGGMPGGTV